MSVTPPADRLAATVRCRRGSSSLSGLAEGRSPSASRSRRKARPPWSCSWLTSPWRGSPSLQPAPDPRWGTLPFPPPGPPCFPPAPRAPAGTWKQEREWYQIWLLVRDFLREKAGGKAKVNPVTTCVRCWPTSVFVRCWNNTGFKQCTMEEEERDKHLVPASQEEAHHHSSGV